MTQLIFFVGFIVAVLILASILKGKPHYPYVAASLLTKTETDFFRALTTALGTDHLIFPKMRLADIINVKSGMTRKGRQIALNRIWAKHIDFTVVAKDSLKVTWAIELDDSTHNLPHRQKRDSFVDQALKAAGIEIRHFKAQRSYDARTITDELFKRTPTLTPPPYN